MAAPLINNEAGQLTEEKATELKEAFKAFDQDKSGKINASELKEVMQKVCGEDITDDQIDAMISAADVDADGEVNYEEFVKMMTG